MIMYFIRRIYDYVFHQEKGRATKGSQLFVEGRGIGNCALIIETHTDKPKWMRQQLQHVLKQYGSVTLYVYICLFMYVCVTVCVYVSLCSMLIGNYKRTKYV